MRYGMVTLKALSLALLLVVGNSSAAEVTAPADKPAAKATENKPATAQTEKKKAKQSSKVKLVDINSATAEQLKKLPGISAEEADKIVAGRPYGSKAWLVSHNIIPAGKYPAIKDLVIAKQPFKDGEKNAALYMKKK